MPSFTRIIIIIIIIIKESNSSFGSEGRNKRRYQAERFTVSTGMTTSAFNIS
jgi:hypothetical protein